MRSTINFKNNPIRFNIILLILCFSIIQFCLYVITQDYCVTGYEISIYDKYPKYFWYLIIMNIFLCQINICSSAFSPKVPSITWKAACVGIVFSNSILILMPLIRSYAIYGLGDPSTHMGLMRDLLDTGRINSNMYPIAHILGVVSHQICGLSLNHIMLLYPLVFYILFSLSVYLLFRVVLTDKTSILIGMTLSLLMFGSYSNTNIAFFPQGLSNYFAPFALYLFFSRFLSTKNEICFSILTIITALFITFFHPLTSLVLISIYLLYDTCSYIHKYMIPNLDANNKSSANLILLMIIIFFIWQSYARVLVGSIRRTYLWLYGEIAGSSMLDTYSELITEIEPDFYLLLSAFIYKYGLWLLFIFLGFLSIVIELKIRNYNNHADVRSFLTFSTAFVIFSSIYFISQIFITGIGIARFGHYAAFLSILITSRAFGHILISLNRSRHTSKLLFISIIILFCLTFLSVFTLYMSPITKSYGQHVADSILIGMDTFFEKRSEDLQIMEGKIKIYRIKDALYGESKNFKNVMEHPEPSLIPPHFNYTNSNYFGDYYGIEVYAIIDPICRIGDSRMIPEYPEKWKYNQTDFFKLENDKSASKIYSNQELEIYLLNPITNINI